MPYEVRKEECGFAVYNKDSGERKACHDTEEKAESQIRLLHELEHED